MDAQTREDNAELEIGLLGVDAEDNQSHGRSAGLPLNMLVCTLVFLLLAVSLVLCVVYDRQCEEQRNVQNAQIEEHSIDRPRVLNGLVAKQPRSLDAVVAPRNVDMSSSQAYIATPNSVGFNKISKRKPGRRFRTHARANMSSFLRIVKDLLHEDLLKLHQKILCLDAHADKEAVALRKRGFRTAHGINLHRAVWTSQYTHEDTQIQKFADQKFDFLFTSMFDRIPCPAFFVSEIERTLKVGGLAAMHVSLNKWCNKYTAGKPGHGIKPVTLLFQHSEIVYVSSANAPGLDTIIVFKKTIHAKAKQVDGMEMDKYQLHGNPLMAQSVARPSKLSSKQKCRIYAEQQQLKTPRYIPELQGTGGLVYGSTDDTFLPSATHFRGEVVMRRSTLMGLPGPANFNMSFFEGLSNGARLKEDVIQGSFLSNGEASVAGSRAFAS